ncbi:MAG: signal recognition particle-docking protein FtsY [Deltaproteobacteria bacterium]|nr:MAG: signal recognition particle-docking protein FtsY [Deltaproteobacteria bacterium]
MAFKWFRKKDKKTVEQPIFEDDIQTDKASADDGSTDASTDGPDDDVLPDEDNRSTPENEEPEPDIVPDPQADDTPQDPETAKEQGRGLFARLKSGLSKTRKILTTDIDELFLGKKLVDEEMIEDLEELLITSDMGVETTMDIMDKIAAKRSRIDAAGELKRVLKEEILSYFENPTDSEEAPQTASPRVVMVVGVNGVGKTTTIGKLATHESRKGKKVLIAAADTFRAAAIEQIAIWADRAGADIVRRQDNADPAAVAYDSIDAAISRGMDTVFVDTAGRLHTKINLMEEIKKIQRTLAKRMPDAPHEVLLVLDATTGQNAISQAKMFNDALGVTGIALTKLDGTAKGGIVVSICNNLNIPLKYIGVGEGVDDLQEFDPQRFVEALF